MSNPTYRDLKAKLDALSESELDQEVTVLDTGYSGDMYAVTCRLVSFFSFSNAEQYIKTGVYLCVTNKS